MTVLILPALMFLAGLVILMKAGDYLVDGAVSIAHKFKLSDVFIGVAIIGFGTSLPELLSSLSAMRLGSPTLAVGNAMGSNIANVGLILGLTLLVAGTFKRAAGQEREYISMMIVTFLFLGALFVFDSINLVLAGLMVAVLFAYLALALMAGKKNFDAALEESAESHEDTNMKRAGLMVALGLLGLFAGAELLVRGAVDIAHFFEVPERIIGLTLMAIGTSLPELAAAISAAKRGRSALTFGNIMGSNVFNLLGVLGVAGLFGTIPLVEGTMTDGFIMTGFAIVLIPLFWQAFAKNASRVWGIGLLVAYFAYIASLAL
ncbi:MAG: calcium/sodium antiporter [Pseudomonadota bacterium]|nr:calcium/sodium antiporter [Pseudomonadota bacterium]